MNIKNDNKKVISVQNWEYLKFTIRKYSITFSKQLNEERKANETKLVTELLSFYSKLNWSVEDKNKIQNLQSQLDVLYLNKAQGAYIRSRAKWIENGEKNTPYFSNLEKRRQDRNEISSLILNREECTEPKHIAKEVMEFYSNLYKSSYSEQNAMLFFDKIDNMIPIIDENFKIICKDDLKIEEFDNFIKKITSDRSPGPNGITANFYKHFWKEIKILLFQAINACVIQK